MSDWNSNKNNHDCGKTKKKGSKGYIADLGRSKYSIIFHENRLVLGNQACVNLANTSFIISCCSSFAEMLSQRKITNISLLLFLRDSSISKNHKISLLMT